MLGKLVSARAFCLLVLTLPAAAAAQETGSSPASPAQDTIAVTAGVAEFDLSGVGTAVVFAARTTIAMTESLALEGGALFARPEQQSGESTIVAPEVQLQYNWRVGRFRPFAGGGVGALLVTSPVLENDWALTLSAAGGTRIALTDRVAVLVEMRLRGVEHDFTGTISEWVGGVSWRLGQ